MISNEKLLVILTPAFPVNVADVNWVPSHQLFLKSVRRLFPEIKIIVLSFIYPHTADNYKWNGIEVHSFDGMKYRKLRRPLLWRKIWRKLSEINKEQKITAILSFWCAECALVGHYFGKRNSIRHFSWICGQDAKAKNKLVKLIRPSSHELIAKSDFLADEFQRSHGIKPAHIIPNGIDPSLYPIQNDKKYFDIIGAGSFNKLKQYDIFLEILHSMKQIFPGIKAILCGHGQEMSHLKKLKEDLQLNEILTMPGMLSPLDVIKMMQRSKILLHPSSYEGFSMACLEALYSGAHVISFVKPMHHEIENWHVVKTKDEMQQKALELLNDPRTIYKPVKVYSMDESAKTMMDLLGFI